MTAVSCAKCSLYFVQDYSLPSTRFLLTNALVSYITVEFELSFENGIFLNSLCATARTMAS